MEGNGVQRELGSHETRLDNIDEKLGALSQVPADIAWIKAKLESKQERKVWVDYTITGIAAAIIGGLSGRTW